MSSIRRIAVLSLVLPVSLIAGCGSDDPGAPPPTMTGDIALTEDAKEPQAEVRASGERQAFDGLEFNVPADWEEVQSEFQGIVSAKFTMPKTAKDVTLTLSRSGGGLEANLDRWREEGGTTLGQRAHLEVARLVAEAPASELPDDRKAELERLMSDEARRHGLDRLPGREP